MIKWDADARYQVTILICVNNSVGSQNQWRKSRKTDRIECPRGAQRSNANQTHTHTVTTSAGSDGEMHLTGTIA